MAASVRGRRTTHNRSSTVDQLASVLRAAADAPDQHKRLPHPGDADELLGEKRWVGVGVVPLRCRLAGLLVHRIPQQQLLALGADLPRR